MTLLHFTKACFSILGKHAFSFRILEYVEVLKFEFGGKVINEIDILREGRVGGCRSVSITLFYSGYTSSCVYTARPVETGKWPNGTPFGQPAARQRPKKAHYGVPGDTRFARPRDLLNGDCRMGRCELVGWAGFSGSVDRFSISQIGI